jgi:hypothetical protein
MTGSATTPEETNSRRWPRTERAPCFRTPRSRAGRTGIQVVVVVTDQPHPKSSLHDHKLNRVMIYFEAGRQEIIHLLLGSGPEDRLRPLGIAFNARAARRRIESGSPVADSVPWSEWPVFARRTLGCLSVEFSRSALPRRRPDGMVAQEASGRPFRIESLPRSRCRSRMCSTYLPPAVRSSPPKNGRVS